MENFKVFVDRVKETNDITSVMEEISNEYRINKRMVHGWCYGVEHQSLAANPNTGLYAWFSHSPAPGQTGSHPWEQGDVFVFLEQHANMDFWQALEYLARRANIEMPKFQREKSEAELKAMHQRENLLDIATDWFERQLWNSPAALAYVRSRGWGDETIRGKSENGQGKIVARGAALGFSGGAATASDSLRDLLVQKGCDVHAPEAVALVGLRGGVQSWCEAHTLDMAMVQKTRWLENDRIWGITDFPRLVYPMRKFGQGKTLYFHCRNLTWEDKTLRAVRDGELTPSGNAKPKMHNPDDLLFGERPLYLNHRFHKNASQILIVEGPADAVSLAQLGYAAIALCGLGATEQLTRLLSTEHSDAVQEGRVYLALDNDEAGQKAIESVCNLLGGMVRVVQWERFEDSNPEPESKPAPEPEPEQAAADEPVSENVNGAIDE